MVWYAKDRAFLSGFIGGGGVFSQSDVWVVVVPPYVGFVGWLFGGMDSKPLFSAFLGLCQYFFNYIHDVGFSI